MQQLVNQVGNIEVVVGSAGITIWTPPTDAGFDFIDVNLEHIARVDIQSIDQSQSDGIDPREVHAFQAALDLTGPVLINATPQKYKQLCIAYGSRVEVIDVIKEITDRINARAKQDAKQRMQGESTTGSLTVRNDTSTTKKHLKTSRGVTKGGEPHLALPAPTRDEADVPRMQKTSLSSMDTTRSRMRDETGDSGSMTEIKVATSKTKPSGMLKSPKRKTPTKAHEKKTLNFDALTSPVDAKSTTKPKAKVTKKKIPQVYKVAKKDPAIASKMEASVPQPRRSDRTSHKGKVKYQESDDAPADDVEEDEPVVKRDKKPSKPTLVEKTISKPAVAQRVNKHSATAKPATAEKTRKQNTAEPSAEQPFDQARTFDDSFNTPSRRKPNIIAFNQAGPVNQGTSPVKTLTKRPRHDAVPEPRSNKRAKQSSRIDTPRVAEVSISAQGITEEEVLDEGLNVTAAIGSLLTLEDQSGSGIAPASELSPAADSDQSPRTSDDEEPSGSQLSKRVDMNGSPYGKEIRLPVYTRSTQSATPRVSHGHSLPEQCTIVAVAPMLPALAPLSIAKGTVATATEQDVVHIKLGVQVAESKLRNAELATISLTHALNQESSIPQHRVSTRLMESPFDAFGKPIATSTRPNQGESDQSKRHVNFARVPLQQDDVHLQDVKEPPIEPLGMTEESEWNDDDETLLNVGEVTDNHATTDAQQAGQRQNIAGYQPRYHDHSSTPGSSAHAKEAESDAVSLNDKTDSESNARGDAVRWEQALTPHCRDVAEALTRITKVNTVCFVTDMSANTPESLLRQLMDEESAARDVVDDYEQSGLALIKRLENIHRSDYTTASRDLNATLSAVHKAMSSTVTSLDHHEKQRLASTGRAEKRLLVEQERRALRSKEIEKMLA